MGRSEGLSQLEQYVLLCLIRLGEEAYGVPVHQEIEERMSRSVSIATVYSALDRLQKDGLITSHLSSPLPERGGRAKRLYRLSADGAAALQRARRVHDSMWEGVDLKAMRRRGLNAKGMDLGPAGGA
jgi:DNA-binding PadR family transcriptional regulator